MEMEECYQLAAFLSPHLFLSKDILKLTTYEKGSWEIIWDSLYWSFIGNTKQLRKITSLLNIIKQYNEKTSDEKKKINSVINSNNTN